MRDSLPSLQQRSNEILPVAAADVFEPLESPRTIEDCVLIGLANNPAVSEARLRVTAASHRIAQADSLPDPVVGTTTHLAPIETAAGEQRFALGLSQKFIRKTKRSTKAAIACDDLAAARANLVQVQLDLSEQIRIACYQLLQVRETIRITREDAESLNRIFEVVARQYEVNQAVSQQDWINIQVEQSKIENKLTNLRSREDTLQSRLARLLHLPRQSPLSIVEPGDVSGFELQIDALVATAERHEPGLQKQLATWRRTKKQAQLAELERQPNFTVGVNWIATSSDGISPVANGNDALLLAIGFNLPVRRDRIRGAVAEARANTSAESFRYQAMKDQVADDVFSLVTKAESTLQMLQLLRRDIIPKASNSLDLTIAEYSAGENSYVQLIENWRTLLAYRIAESQLVSEQRQTMASLSRLVGDLGHGVTIVDAMIE